MSEAAETLAAVIAAKPGGENRPGQEAMCAAVDAALASGEHLLVEAPTGIGKSLAYLAPAARARAAARRTRNGVRRTPKAVAKVSSRVWASSNTTALWGGSTLPPDPRWAA